MTDIHILHRPSEAQFSDLRDIAERSGSIQPDRIAGQARGASAQTGAMLRCDGSLRYEPLLGPSSPSCHGPAAKYRVHLRPNVGRNIISRLRSAAGPS